MPPPCSPVAVRLTWTLQFFPVGMCTRTVLGKAEVVLWRTDAQAFRLEVWRSFAPYVAQFLGEASRGII